MRSFPYVKSHAFTSESSGGNPAALIELVDERLSGAQMLAIAREHRHFVSEVIFSSRSDVADIKLTYWSSECEVAFCGHGTIAAAYSLIRDNPALSSQRELLVETNRKGILTVYNRIEEEDAVYISAPEAQWPVLGASIPEIVPALGIDRGALSPDLPVAFIDAGLRTLLVPINSLEHELSISPDQETLRAFCEDKEIDIVLIFTMETKNPSWIAHTRVFAPRFGYLEDPATGSGNAAFANYLLAHGLWNGLAVSVEQGSAGDEFNEIKLLKKGDEVLFGGRATVRIKGSYFVNRAQ